jgi:radical SAM superfamily enzyme YgiQ (UPF0313 family)
MINASFVFGLDSDTKETFKATLDWIVRNRIETVTSHILTPYPGTELYRGYLWIYDQVYSYKNIIRRIPKSLKQVPSYLMFNFFYRKWGRFTDWLCEKISYERIGYWGEKLSKYL